MNYSTAVMLVNKSIRAVRTIYQPEIASDRTKQTRYTFKTIDENIKVGDLVLVPTDTRFGFTVNEVVEVDIDVDFDSNVQVKWVVSKVDLKAYEEIHAMENRLIDVIKKGELRKRRETIMQNTLDAATAGEIEGLDIAKLSPKTIAAPAPSPDDTTNS